VACEEKEAKQENAGIGMQFKHTHAKPAYGTPTKRKRAEHRLKPGVYSFALTPLLKMERAS
jgi:hypothetical protein